MRRRGRRAPGEGSCSTARDAPHWPGHFFSQANSCSRLPCPVVFPSPLHSHSFPSLSGVLSASSAGERHPHGPSQHVFPRRHSIREDGRRRWIPLPRGLPRRHAAHARAQLWRQPRQRGARAGCKCWRKPWAVRRAEGRVRLRLALVGLKRCPCRQDWRPWLLLCCDSAANDASVRWAAALHGWSFFRRAQVDTTKLYEALGVDKQATKGQIKKAYLKLARTVSVLLCAGVWRRVSTCTLAFRSAPRFMEDLPSVTCALRVAPVHSITQTRVGTLTSSRSSRLRMTSCQTRRR